MRHIRPLFIALPVLLALLALPAGPMGRTAHAAPTNPNIAQVAIDLDPTGNTGWLINGHGVGAVVPGDIQDCIRVEPGAVFNINVVLNSLPVTPTVADRLAGFSFDITYPTAASTFGTPPNLVAPGLVLGNDDDLDGLYDEDTQSFDADNDGDGPNGEEGGNPPYVGHDTAGGDNPTDFPANTGASVILPASTDISVANGLVPGAWNVWQTIAYKLSAFTTGPRSGVMDWIRVTAGLTPGVYPLTLTNVNVNSSAHGDYSVASVRSAGVIVGSPPLSSDPCEDDDGDGVANVADNCISVSNPTQANIDDDQLGDACDADIDGDGLANASDNCPTAPNADQTNTDVTVNPPGDGLGDTCDPDDDDDGYSDAEELATGPGNAVGSDPVTPVSTPERCDGLNNDGNEGIDEGFLNTDGDSMADCVDLDDDNDGVIDLLDNCPTVPNPGQADFDVDRVGDVCDDFDGDGSMDATDNCLVVPNPSQSNSDGDTLGDACDADDDNDGVLDIFDNCRTVPNATQANGDGDSLGDACDACPATVMAWSTPLGDDDCDAFPSSAYDPDTERSAESFMGTNPNAACAATTTLNDEAPDPWPMDNNDDRKAALGDILQYIPVFGTTGPGLPYKARYDLNQDNKVNLADILMFIPFFGVTCTP